MSSAQTDRSSGSSSPTRPLARGQACMPCRWRKVRCDGVRPTCNQCAKADPARECNYHDASTSHASNLQKTVTQLEARVRQLEQEGPSTGSSAVFLRDPYSDSPLQGSPISPFSRSPSVGIAFGEWPSPNTCALLTDTFFQHVQCLPWFLHEGRYRQASTLPEGGLGRPIAALEATVLLWGSIIYLRSQGLPVVDAGFLLDQASSQVGVANAAGPQAIQVIQACLLLADYLLDSSRVLEGRAQLSAATSLAFRLRLHKIRSGQELSPRISFLDPITMALPEPQDTVEEGERIRAFWSVFSFSRMQAVVFAHHSLLLDSEEEERRVDTPWPLDMSMYEHGQMPPNLRSTDTLRRFLEGVGSGWPWDNDILTILAKASALFQRTANIAAVSLRDATTINLATSLEQIRALDQRVDELETQLAPLTAGPTGKLHLARSLVLASRLQLHSVFSEQCPVSRVRCLAAARAIWETSTAAGVDTFVYLDTVIGWIWATACRVIMNEIVQLRAQDTGLQGIDMATEPGLMQVLDGIFALMTAIAARSSSMNYQLSRVEQERIVLG
ncbi:unnamed protein product [Peniophora sp. CBMAI 1063]|nr:unnamed protein product [Peniophora sp. CBMAI 1063]